MSSRFLKARPPSYSSVSVVDWLKKKKEKKKDLFLCQIKGVVDAHWKTAATRIWIFCHFQTEKHDVYNIYVAINVPSFFKLDRMCIYFAHLPLHIYIFPPFHNLCCVLTHRKEELWNNGIHLDFLIVFVILFLRHFYSGFRPNECFIVCNSFLKVIPVDHCSLYEKYYEYMFLFLIKCDSSVLYMCCAPTFSFLQVHLCSIETDPRALTS